MSVGAATAGRPSGGSWERPLGVDLKEARTLFPIPPVAARVFGHGQRRKSVHDRSIADANQAIASLN